MRDKTLIDPFAAQEIFCDGFTDYKVRNGNMSCVGFRIQDPEHEGGKLFKVIVVRLIFPKDCVTAAIEETQRAISDLPAPSIGLWLRKAH